MPNVLRCDECAMQKNPELAFMGFLSTISTF